MNSFNTPSSLLSYAVTEWYPGLWISGGKFSTMIELLLKIFPLVPNLLNISCDGHTKQADSFWRGQFCRHKILSHVAEFKWFRYMMLNMSHFGKHQIRLMICMPAFLDWDHLDVLNFGFGFGFAGVVNLSGGLQGWNIIAFNDHLDPLLTVVGFK